MRIKSIQFDRAIAKGRSGRIAFIALAILIVVPIAIWLVGFVGQCIFSHIEPTNELSKGLFWDTIEVYLDPSNKPETFRFTKRFYFLFVGTAGVFLLNGLLVSMLVSWFENRRDRWEKGDLHYGKNALGNFAVVIGGNEMVPDLVGQILKDKSIDHVLVMTNRDVATLRKKLVSEFAEEEERVVIYYGERTSKDDLKRLLLQHSKNDIYVIGEQLDVDQSGSHHDVKNMDCVEKIAELLKEAGSEGKKTCRVMFEYQSTFSVFQFADVCGSISDVLDFKPFNYYETWAQKVLVNKELDLRKTGNAYLPLEGKEPITAKSEDSVHLIVVGMSRMGIAMAVEAAHIAHYPNFISKGIRTRITFIDSEVRREMNFFQGHYKELFAVSPWRYVEADVNGTYYEACKFDEAPWMDSRKENDGSPYKDREGYTLGEELVDVEWQFIKGDLEMPSVQRFIDDEARKAHSRLTIAICFPKDNASLAASLYLPDAVYEDNSSVQQVLVYQPYGDAMQRSFDVTADKRKSYRLFEKIRAFGMVDSCYNVEFQRNLDTISDAFGNAYGSVSQTMRGGLRGNSMTNSAWKKPAGVGKSLAARQWSNIYNGQHMWTKLRSVGFEGYETFDWNEEVVNLLAQVEHIRWNMEQLLLGFAPLKANEQQDMLNTFGKEKPEKQIKKLIAGEEADVASINEWLLSWEEFDSKKEILKANMSHLDISSNKRLREVDGDAVIYDVELVRILPELYTKITNKNEDTNGTE